MTRRIILWIILACWLALGIEGVVRLVHAVYPLERPAALREDPGPMQLLAGDWKNGRTRFYQYTPHVEGMTHGHRFRANARGLRGPEILPRTDARFRILVLGDSLTVGVGVAEESRYSNVLARLLLARYPHRQIEVVNAGVQGFETPQEEQMLYHLWDAVQPDLVILGFFFNDVLMDYTYANLYALPMPAWLQPVLRRSLAVRLLDKPYDWAYRTVWGLPFLLDLQRQSLQTTAPSWPVFEQSVDRMARFIRQRSALPPIAIYLFEAEQAQRDWAQALVSQTFRAHGFIWVDAPAHGYAPVSRFEAHPDARSHAAYAHALLETLIAQRVLD